MSHLTLIEEPPHIAPRMVAPAPRPMSFAILRNAHEAFRTGIRLQRQALDVGDTQGFRTEWRAFQRALAVHVAMEERLFLLLDHVGAGAIGAVPGASGRPCNCAIWRTRKRSSRR